MQQPLAPRDGGRQALFLLRPLPDCVLLSLLRCTLPLLQIVDLLPRLFDFAGPLGQTRGGIEGGFEGFLKEPENGFGRRKDWAIVYWTRMLRSSVPVTLFFISGTAEADKRRRRERFRAM